MKLFLTLFTLASGRRVAQSPETDQLELPGKFSRKTFPVSERANAWSLEPLESFRNSGGDLGMVGTDFVANGQEVTLEVVQSNRLGLLTDKHSHYAIMENGQAVAWMRSKFNAASGYDWDLLPGDAVLKKGWGSNKSPEAKKMRKAKGKGIIYQFNPTYFAKAYIKGPDAGKSAKDVYYTITHLNPISKGMSDLGESHIRIARGWCKSARKDCELVAEILCTFYHQSCTIKTQIKGGEEIGSIQRNTKNIGSGGNWKVTATSGDVFLFAQAAGFIDMVDDWKRTKTLAVAKYPVNVAEKVR